LLQWFFDCFAAVDGGKACLVPVYGPHPEPSEAKLRILAESDRLHAKLTAERAG
jgi:hypothetical protein